MTTEAVGNRPSIPAPRIVMAPPRAVRSAVTTLVLRQIRRSAAVVIVAAAGMSALVAVQYQSTFAGALDGPALQALAANPAIRVMFGPPLALDDPGGFTVWRTGTPVAVLVGAWALLVATRITRGEEDAGRWDLLLAGRVRPADLVTRYLAVLAAVAVAVGAAVTVALLAAGTTAMGGLLHGAGIAGIGLWFAAFGVLAAQVLPARAAATGTSVAALAVALLMRMVADGTETLAWLRWVTPFGILGEVQPYAADRPAPLVLLVAVALLLAGAARAVAGRRDTRAGLFDVSNRRPRIRLLGSVGAFAVRRALPTFTGWTVGVLAYYLLIGTLTVSITAFLTGNPRFAELAAGAGFVALGSAEGFAAALFSLLAIPAGLYGAARIAATAADETSRRAVLLFALPVSRIRLVSIDIAVATAGTVLLLAAAGLAMWTGAATAGAPLGVGDALAGALNVAPVALLCIGAAVLALG
ncbi:polyketide antibiotic transporter [Pseudonocardia xinjiangensis]|uniref:polyketide antibiotic transporter n=1 Tax=Pseudonocardia xinjiangensis TaxID=75289 RepID=UPI003D8E95EA